MRLVPATLVLAAVAAVRAPAQQDSAARVRAIVAPRAPLPAERATARIKRFSFIAYGDTRSAHDGTEPQEPHGLVVTSVLQTIASLYPYAAERDLRQYLADGAAQHLGLQHLVVPADDSLRNPHHYLLVHVDGEKIRVEAVGVGRCSRSITFSGAVRVQVA